MSPLRRVVAQSRRLGLLGRLRLVHFAPVLAFLALAAWAFASPVGASPDDDYHLTSTWCALGGSDECRPGTEAGTREVAAPLTTLACFRFEPETSAACQRDLLGAWGEETVETGRGNFDGAYPPLFYATMRLFAGGDLQLSALVMRLVNAALFVALATAVVALAPVRMRSAVLWGWLVTVVPLGMFVIASNNPSGWALTGVGTAFTATLAWHGTVGGRRAALGALAAVGVLMAAGSRADAAVYAAGALVAATIIAGPWRGSAPATWWRWAWLPLAGVLVSAGFALASGQAGIAGTGFSGSGGSLPPPEGGPTGFALVAYNLLSLPNLWTGVWGSWPLGWVDTRMPAIVVWGAAAAFVALGFAGLGWLDRRKAVAVAGVLAVLVVVPVYVLTRAGNVVGQNVQPRYLLPLIALLAFALLAPVAAGGVRLTRAQTAVVLAALGVAHLVALQVDIRRYVTGVGRQGFDLDTGAEWWWTGFPVGPTWVWVIGALAFAGMLAALWPELRGTRQSAERVGVDA